MNSTFGSTATVATSSDVESSFNSLKNFILSGKMSQAHAFIRTHVDFVNAEIKLNAISTSDRSDEPKARKRSNSVSSPLRQSSHKRQRSNSNQYELSPPTQNDDHENGKNGTLQLYRLLDQQVLYIL